jgi:8-oxo-dGTP diphosphatase
MKVGVGVAVVVKRGQRILLIKRNGKHGAGTWSVPGGWMEPGEGPIAAARRELQEEVGLEADADCLGQRGYTWTVHPEGVEDVCLWFMDATPHDFSLTPPRIMEPEKIADLGWFPSYHLPQPLFPPFISWIERRPIG